MAYWFGQHGVRLPLQRARWRTVLITGAFTLGILAAWDVTRVAWGLRIGAKTVALAGAAAILLASAGGIRMVERILKRKRSSPARED